MKNHLSFSSIYWLTNNFWLTHSYISFIYSPGFIVDGHTIEYIVSIRGKLQLLIDGYPYYRYAIEKNKTTYNCVQNRILGFVWSFFFLHLIENYDEKEWNDCCYECNFYSLFIQYRCQAKARVIGKNDRVEFVNVSHNHPAILPRRASGEAKRMFALQKMKKKSN